MKYTKTQSKIKNKNNITRNESVPGEYLWNGILNKINYEKIENEFPSKSL